jgi:hypothetical protein
MASLDARKPHPFRAIAITTFGIAHFGIVIAASADD